VLQLIERFETRASISIQHASNALIFKKSAKDSSLIL
jgi:hypothetical protein